VIARTWSRRVRIRTSDNAVFQAVRYLECDPEIAVEPASNLAISIEPYRSYYRIVQDGTVAREQMSAQGVTESLHAVSTPIASDVLTCYGDIASPTKSWSRSRFLMRTSRNRCSR
jgi:hypothetical protein